MTIIIIVLLSLLSTFLFNLFAASLWGGFNRYFIEWKKDSSYSALMIGFSIIWFFTNFIAMVAINNTFLHHKI